VRDKAKKAYIKEKSCAICAGTEDLELHHLASVTLLLNAWAQKTGYDISTDEGIIAVRDEFILAHDTEMYSDVYTLCNKHHTGLHKIFGKAPSLSSSDKQRAWIDKQRDKQRDNLVAGVEPIRVVKSSFAEFC
jgi:hypothetical protein